MCGADLLTVTAHGCVVATAGIREPLLSGITANFPTPTRQQGLKQGNHQRRKAKARIYLACGAGGPGTPAEDWQPDACREDGQV